MQPGRLLRRRTEEALQGAGGGDDHDVREEFCRYEPGFYIHREVMLCCTAEGDYYVMLPREPTLC